MALLSGALLCGPAVAGQLNAEVFRPSEHPGDLFGVKTNAIAEGFDPGFGLVAHWGRNPLVFVAQQGTDEVTHAVVEDQLALEMIASIALFQRLDLAVAAPLFIQGSSGTPLLGEVDGTNGFAMGDLRVSLKGLLVREKASGFGVGLDVTASFPTARARSYAGDDAFTVTPLILVDYESSYVRVALNVGWRIRSAEAVLDAIRVGNEMLLSVGAEVPLYAGLSVGGELQSATDAGSPFADEKTNQLEGRLGLRYRFESGLSMEGGGGAGFLEGYGNVAARAFLGVRYELGASRPAPLPFDDDPEPPVARVEQPPPAEPEAPIEPTPPAPAVVEIEAPRLVVLASAALEDALPRRATDDVATVEVPVEAEQVAEKAATPALPPNYLSSPVYFGIGQERVPMKWRPILDDAAKRLREEPHIRLVHVVAHADEKWGDGVWSAANMRLSWRRAKWVKAALIRRGVEPERLEALGVGDTRPIGDSSTPEGRQANQSVEFIIDDGSSR